MAGASTPPPRAHSLGPASPGRPPPAAGTPTPAAPAPTRAPALPPSTASYNARSLSAARSDPRSNPPASPSAMSAPPNDDHRQRLSVPAGPAPAPTPAPGSAPGPAPASASASARRPSRPPGAVPAPSPARPRRATSRNARPQSHRRADSADDDGQYGPLDPEDDEVKPLDRGEELVKRRFRERQRERRRLEKQQQQQQQQRRPPGPHDGLALRSSLSAKQSGAQHAGSLGAGLTPEEQRRHSTASRTGSMLSDDRGRTELLRPSSEFGTDASESDLGAADESNETWSNRGRHTWRSASNLDRPYSRTDSVAIDDVEAHGGDADLSSSMVDDTAVPIVGPSQEASGDHDAASGNGDADPDEEQEDEEGEEDEAGQDDDDEDEDDDVEYTLKDRQDAINIEHPFGLPIWKPALYKKNRSITRNAETALHNMPSVAAERHLLPGNMLWTLLCGSWLSALCFVIGWTLELVPIGGSRYARVVRELGAYIFWPFGKYVEVELVPNVHRHGQQVEYTLASSAAEGDVPSEAQEPHTYENEFTPVVARFPHDHTHQIAFNSRVVHTPPSHPESSGTTSHQSSGSGSPSASRLTDATMIPPQRRGQATENTPLTRNPTIEPNYGAAGTPGFGRTLTSELKNYGYVYDDEGHDVGLSRRWAGKLAYGLAFWLVLGPLMGIVCLLCWGGVFSIPMAKLTWILLKNLATQPLALHMHSAEYAAHMFGPGGQLSNAAASGSGGPYSGAPQPGPVRSTPHGFVQKFVSERHSTILLCTYRAVGWQYYKYTVGGVNILFVNTLPLVFFTIFDFFFLSPWLHNHGFNTGFWAAISSHSLIFILALGSVIPLSYFIGMAVASISAQSSIGMGAVINATFGSIIEIILYSIALTQDKARLVEGSIVGSILAGVLLMPGLSMISGASRRKEQRFNARSAGVTSTMLIMAIIGILTPTLFYQIYGTFQLTCKDCPDGPDAGPGWTGDPGDYNNWHCRRCFYEHVPPDRDEFFQTNVKGLIYTCTIFLVLSYGVGLWFSLRTHASQIWQNPTSIPRDNQLPSAGGGAPAPPPGPGHVGQTQQSGPTAPHTSMFQLDPQRRASTYKRLAGLVSSKSGSGRPEDMPPLQLPPRLTEAEYARAMGLTVPTTAPSSSTATATAPASAPTPAPAPAATPKDACKQGSRRGSRVGPTRPGQGPRRFSLLDGPQQQAPPTSRAEGAAPAEQHDSGSGGHDGPSWSRTVSMSVLLGCTVLYAIIAEVLVDVVDVVLEGSGLDEKFLGITLFALVPNTTEFMNAMSFAINGNIALSMEIGSAYALQVCLIQIPAMVIFSAWYNAHLVGAPSMSHVFTLIFPRWDVIAIVFSIFLITYTYIESRSNYHRGSILFFSYCVLVAGFFFAPNPGQGQWEGDDAIGMPQPGYGANTLSELHYDLSGSGRFGASPLPRTWSSSSSAAATALGDLAHYALPPHWGVSRWVQAIWGSLWAR